jgi:hypothetical protein
MNKFCVGFAAFFQFCFCIEFLGAFSVSMAIGAYIPLLYLATTPRREIASLDFVSENAPRPS